MPDKKRASHLYRSAEVGSPPPVTWDAAVWDSDTYEDSGPVPLADQSNLSDLTNAETAVANLGAGNAGKEIFRKSTRQQVLEYLDPPGDMEAAVYDPQGRRANVYDLANATGTIRDARLPTRLQQPVAVVYIQANDPGAVGAGAIWIIP